MNLIAKKNILQTIPFAVQELNLKIRDKQKTYHRLLCPDWVNVFAMDDNDRIILIEQKRAGILQTVLETPGGCIDEGEKPELAAARELEEETCYRAGELILMGKVAANPAIQTNNIYYFLARNCQHMDRPQFLPDDDEEITVKLTSMDEVENLMSGGQVNHSYSYLCILMALKRLGV